MTTTKIKKQEDEDFSSKISDEINCAICLDILVNPRTLVPCGHSFCRSCCFSNNPRKTLIFNKCPHCRQAIVDTVPSRKLESVINTLVTVPNLLFRNDDDKQHYLERRKKEKERSSTPPATQVSAGTRKRQRRDNYYHNSTANYAAPVPVNPQNFQYQPNYYHGPQDVGASFQSASSFATTSRSSTTFDPMIAPLPPPFDFTAAGPVPVLNFAGPANSRGSQPPQRTTQRTTNSRGISANDPICID